MLNRLRERFGAKVLAIGVATALLGGGVAMASLVEPAKQALAQVAAQIGVAEKADLGDTELDDTETEVGLVTDAGTAQIDFLDNPEDHPIHDVEDVPDEVKLHFIAVMEYVSCIQREARAHGEKQANGGDEDDEFTDEEKIALCGDEPVNLNDEEGENGLEGESDRRPAFLGDGEGRPAFLGEGEGRPAFLGEGEGRPGFAGGEDRP